MNRVWIGLHLLLSACLIGLVLGCQKTESPLSATSIPDGPVWFADVTEAVGISFLHDPGPVGTFFMPQQVGSGAAFLDFNNDGLLDIYLLQNGGPNSTSTNRLYRQKPDGTFEDVSKGSGLDIAGWNMGVAVADVNNDGWPDILVTQYDGIRLFLNRKDGTFVDVTKESGLNNPGWGTSAAFFDYDRDGLLDLVVVNYVDYDPTWPCTGPYGKPDYCAPKTFRGRVSRLFHNVSQRPPAGAPGLARVRFEDVTVSSGLGAVPGPGLGVLCADFDGDGWPDIFIANDGAPNRLWINRHDGSFREEAVQRGVACNAMAQAQAGMGIAYGDVDGDGLMDIFVTHLTEETHTLWKQGPRGLFQDRTPQAGLTQVRGTGFGTALVDFDHDGCLDLAIVNGRVSANPRVEDHCRGPFWSQYAERNQLLINEGQGRFRDISASNPAFCGKFDVSRGLVCGDFNKDGAIDLLVTGIGQPARLFRNVAPKRGHWLAVRALDPELHRDALGAEVRIFTGKTSRICTVQAAESYLCSREPLAHFGLGNEAQIDTIEIAWPDGTHERFPGCNADQRVELRKGNGEPLKSRTP
jgi:hypothetical protein